MTATNPRRVKSLQTEPVFGRVASNLEAAGRLLGEATADLVVLPELFATGYAFRDRAEASSMSETFPDGPTCRSITAWSERTGGVVVGGFVEREGQGLFNSACVAVAGTPVLAYRKMHLFGFEPEVFDPGDTDLPVVEHEGLRVGVMICFDWMFPEAARVLALEGADVIAHPSNLVLQWCQRAMQTRALENGVYVVTTNRVGAEHRAPRPPLRFTGHSVIVDPMGETLAEGSADTPQVLDATIDLTRARDKTVPSGNDRIAERRPAAYRVLTRANTAVTKT